MPGRKEKSQAALKKATYLRTGSAKMAADVKIQHITDYLCNAGPGLCPRCPSRCAYGQRYLDEVLKEDGQ